jgi:hypothetical protein
MIDQNNTKIKYQDSGFASSHGQPLKIRASMLSGAKSPFAGSSKKSQQVL